jgi:acetyl-CoA carboxylase/biotin carboxylase 1
MGGWAQTVVTGRARIGGFPVGVIAVETRSITKTIPSDPASRNSSETCIMQAGQVWHPDSAFKTAQTINDLNNGEQLPLFILANWRGFSGGMNDMYHEILKFGSMIVEALSEFRQPVFVYLPPHAELRGGAWVVLDSKINPGAIEMYADPNSRAGILEPEGVIEIKLRDERLLKVMARKSSLGAEEASKSSQNALQVKQALLPTYRQVGHRCPDFHNFSSLLGGCVLCRLAR